MEHFPIKQKIKLLEISRDYSEEQLAVAQADLIILYGGLLSDLRPLLPLLEANPDQVLKIRASALFNITYTLCALLEQSEHIT